MVNQRLGDFKKKMTKYGLDAYVVVHSDSVKDKLLKYLLGISFNPCLLMIFPRKKPVLYVSVLDKLDNKELKLLEGVTVKILDRDCRPYECLKGANSIGVSDSVITKSVFDRLKKNIRKEIGVTPKFKSTDLVNDMRIIKYADEQLKLRKAISITERILEGLFKEFKKKTFTYESEVVNYLTVETIKAGCTLSFDPVVASGKESANPHYYCEPRSKLKKGFCIIDFGVCYDGYHADITRTVYFGKPSRADLLEYNKVLVALNYCESEFIAGDVMKEVFSNFQRDNFEMIHALGHGIGLDIHELPPISGSGMAFESGQTVAIEPGHYVKGKFGIRIEDDFLVTEKGLKCLCKLSRDLKRFDL